MQSYSCRSQDRVDDPSGTAFRQRFRSRSHVRYSMKTFLSLVPAGSRGCSTLLVIPAARRRGTGSRGEISQGFALSRSEYAGVREGLGDIRNRGNQGGWCSWRLGLGEALTRRLGGSLGGGCTWVEVPGARVLGVRGVG